MSSMRNSLKELGWIKLGAAIAAGLAALALLYVEAVAGRVSGLVVLVVGILLIGPLPRIGRRVQATSLGQWVVRATTSPRVPTEAFLSVLGFSDRAIEQFVQRTSLDRTAPRHVDSLIRHLLYQEGRIVDRAPSWAPLGVSADAYLQVGDWLWLMCEWDADGRRLSVVTVEVRDAPFRWDLAAACGWIATPPPYVLKETGGDLARAWVPEIVGAVRLPTPRETDTLVRRLCVSWDDFQSYADYVWTVRDAHLRQFGPRRRYGVPNFVWLAVQIVGGMLAIILLVSLT
jgi:hypothetical protein